MANSNSLVRDAIDFAVQAHREQFRASGKPYITHVVAVMEILATLDFDEETLAIAVLHDVFEDTSINLIEISAVFGDRIAFALNALSKRIKPVQNEEWVKKYQQAKKRKEKQADVFEEYIDHAFSSYLRKFYLGMVDNNAVMYVKMADQIHNLSDMEALSPAKKRRKIDEVERFFLPEYQKIGSAIQGDSTRYEHLLAHLQAVIAKARELAELDSLLPANKSLLSLPASSTRRTALDNAVMLSTTNEVG